MLASRSPSETDESKGNERVWLEQPWLGFVWTISNMVRASLGRLGTLALSPPANGGWEAKLLQLHSSDGAGPQVSSAMGDPPPQWYCQ